ncbi:MAG: NUDIX hydrolase [Phycisphaerae bacterium]|nr:NUDIX hydrolase [Phycisphaerae bacterium]
MGARKATQPIEQAGVIAHRRRADGLVQVLLVTSRSGGWVVPKGHVEEGQTGAEAARVEAFEEAGLIGRVQRASVGWYDYEKLGTTRRVALFLMHVERVLSRWPEMDERRREWVSIDEAIRRVPHAGLRDVLERVETDGVLRVG